MDFIYDGTAVKFCPCCGSKLKDMEMMADGTVDYYCNVCDTSGDISIDRSLSDES